MGDLRHAIRSLLKARGFAAVAVLTLALGIGVNASLFSMGSAFFLQPLPIKDPHQLVLVMQRGDVLNMPYGHSYRRSSISNLPRTCVRGSRRTTRSNRLQRLTDSSAAARRLL